MIRVWRRYVPHGITLLSLLLGLYAIEQALLGFFEFALYILGLSAVCDVMDGWVARSLGVASVEGKVLDSLVDLVSFGVVPALSLRAWMVQAVATGGAVPWVGGVWLYFSFCYVLTLAAAVRLMRFTVAPTRDVFYGLPTPAMALFVLSLVVLLDQNPYWLGYLGLSSWVILVGVILLLSVFMLVTLPMLSLRFRGWRWVDNAPRYLFWIGAFFCLYYMKQVCLVGIVLWYITLSLLTYLRFLGRKTLIG